MKDSIKQNQSVLVGSVLVASIVAFALGWTFANNIDVSAGGAVDSSGAVAGESLKIRDLDEVWGELQESYYDAGKLKLSRLEYGAVKGFVGEIEDPYTVFMTPEESEDFKDGLEGQIKGIGAQLEVKNGQLIIVTPLGGSPAEKAGLRPGDIIYKINGEEAAEMTFFEAVYKIRGEKGTDVTLTVLREGVVEPLEIKITRGEITVSTIELKKLGDGEGGGDNGSKGDIYHLIVHQFNDHGRGEFENAVQEILLNDARGIILDIRSNGGGFMETSIEMLSEFIAGEKTAVIVKKRGKANESVKTSGAGRLADIPLVVLINKGSASASEIVAGAVQDYKRGVVIGETTFGKGTMQEIDRLQDGASLRMTVAKWFTPLDRSADEVGIKPDIEVKITEADYEAERDPQLEEALRYLKNQ